MKYAGPRDLVPRVVCVADGSAYAAILSRIFDSDSAE